ERDEQAIGSRRERLERVRLLHRALDERREIDAQLRGEDARAPRAKARRPTREVEREAQRAEIELEALHDAEREPMTPREREPAAAVLEAQREARPAIRRPARAPLARPRRRRDPHRSAHSPGRVDAFAKDRERGRHEWAGGAP